MFGRKKRGKISWSEAPDIAKRIKHLISTIGIDWLDATRIFCFRSVNANTRAYARIWGLGRIWQIALGTKPAYVIEVISEKYDDLNDKTKDEILLHEITHIPRNFSGSLVPHFRRGSRRFDTQVDRLISDYNNKRR